MKTMFLIRTIAMGLVLLVIAACGFLGERRSWTENVQLDDGSVITVKRYVRFEESNSWAGDAYSATESSDQPALEVSQLQLPESLRGTWSPYSKSLQEFGDLTLGTDSLSWGTCTKTAYRVLQVVEQTYYLELLRSPPCILGSPASFLILAPSDRGLEVSICGEREELDRAAPERRCSWGILNKKDE